MTGIVVVGASLAGAHAASAIRKSGFDGQLVIVGREPHQPYDRPPLSKEFLTGDGDEARLPLPVAGSDRLEATWRLNVEAEGLNLETRSIDLSDGSSLAFEGLVIATGASARSLPATIRSVPTDATPAEAVPADAAPTDLAVDNAVTTSDSWVAKGVVTLRTLDDARRLRQLLTDGAANVVICGAGFIGAEVAASARQLGLGVTVVDVAETPLSRVLDETVGSALSGFLAGHGVEMVMGQAVEAVETTSGVVSSVVLSSGRRLPADVLVVGIGALPETGWLEGSGLSLAGAPHSGVIVDEFCRAGEAVVAAGDVAAWPNGRLGGRLMRVEQWDNAVEMGQYAGRSLVAALQGKEPDEPYCPVPWFWSDQFDRKIQLAGVVSDDWHDTVGSPDDERFVRAYFDGGELCGVLAWNRPRQAIIGRQLISSGADRSEALERLTPASS